jgi:hypothetical protein
MRPSWRIVIGSRVTDMAEVNQIKPVHVFFLIRVQASRRRISSQQTSVLQQHVKPKRPAQAYENQSYTFLKGKQNECNVSLCLLPSVEN